MKKFLFTILFFVFAFFIFFIFQNEKKQETTFNFWTVQLKAPVGDLIQKNIDEFQKKHPDIKIVWVDIPITEAQKRTIASILGGNTPDLINLNPEYSVSLAQKGALEFFNEEDVLPYNEGLVEKLKYKDKIYALPFYATSSVMILNREKFKNCNVELKTYGDILKLKNCEKPPVFGIALNEGDAFSKILNKYNAVNSDNFEKVYKMFDEMNKNKLLLKDTLTINHREAIEKYMAESSSFMLAGSNFITMIKQNAPDVYKKSVILPQLVGDSGEFDVSLMNFVIPKKAKNKELAKEFAAMLLDEENQLELSKRTNVLPVNKNVLKNDYFKKCSKDLVEQARCIASVQLNNPIKSDFGYRNKKEINEVINKSLEELIINNKFSSQKTFNEVKILMEN